uniref:Uncharacterized protein n=1 Tax=Solanum tuberosum TaxID=4113 RepID=M1BMA4_SOLTU
MSHAGHENTQIDHSLDHRAPATPQHHIQNKQQVPNRSQVNATSQAQVQKIQDSNDNISGRQDLIIPTSEIKKRDHPGPTGDNSQQNGKDNDQTPSNNKSKGKPSKKKRETIKRRQQKEAEIQGTKVQETQIPRNKNQQQHDDNSNHIRTKLN